MARKAKNTTPPPRTDVYYDEAKIKWEQVAKEPGQAEASKVFNAVNLDAPDTAMVCFAHFPGGQSRWFYRASNGVLIERQYLMPGIAETQFTAQVRAINWLNEQRKRGMPTPEQISEDEKQRIAVEMGYVNAAAMTPAVETPPPFYRDETIIERGAPPVVPSSKPNLNIVRGQVASISTDAQGERLNLQGETAQDGKAVLTTAFPRRQIRDSFTGKWKDVPADTPHPDIEENEPTPDVVHYGLDDDDNDDEVVAPPPKRRITTSPRGKK